MRSKSDRIEEIFEYWAKVMNKPKAKLINTRIAKINARLKEGYTMEDIKLGIDGCAKSPHHMGKNDTGTIYDELTLICRNGDKLEGFMDKASRPIPPGGPGGYQAVHAHQQGFLDSLQHNAFIDGKLSDEK